MSFEKNVKNNNGKNPKTSKKNNKKKKALKIFSITTIILVVLAIGVLAAATSFVYSIISETIEIDGENPYEGLFTNSFIYDSAGEVIEEVQTDERRIIVDFSEVPEIVQNAFVAIEDERFYQHDGLDFRRIVGAAYTNLTTGARQGGSTITQQLVKNLYLTFDQTYTRKIQDMYLAIQLEQQLSKDQILEAYLNTVNMGSLNYGVEAASQAYFSKSVSELGLVESALIAGITRNPSRYTPIRYLYESDITEDHYVFGFQDEFPDDDIVDDGEIVDDPEEDPEESEDEIEDDRGELVTVFDERAIPRYRLVLNAMLRNEYITQAEYDYAVDANLVDYINPSRFSGTGMSSSFSELVVDEVVRDFVEQGIAESEDDAKRLLRTNGYHIYSTMDRDIQTKMEEELNNPDNFIATYEDGSSEPLFINEVVQPQVGMTIVDPYTGAIRGIVGGRNVEGRRTLNRATKIPRQPGSAIKPISAYGPALLRGYTAASIIDDVPLRWDSHEPDRLWPTNVTSNWFRGLTPLRDGLIRSSNVVAVRLMRELGSTEHEAIEIMHQSFDNYGFQHNNRTRDQLSAAIGGMLHGVTPLEMAAAYGTYANDGVLNENFSYTHVEDRNGNIILESNNENRRIMDPQNNYIMHDMLYDVVNSSISTTPSHAKISGMPVAGKTGTTNEATDIWFAGYTPYYSAAVWIGNDTNSIPLKDRSGNFLTSASASRVWSTVMSRVHEDLESKSFPSAPDGIVTREVSSYSGKVPSDLTREMGTLTMSDGRVRPAVHSEIFVRGTEPTEECDALVKIVIHERTGTIVQDYDFDYEFDSDEFEERIFFIRPAPYGPDTPLDLEDFPGVNVSDYAYQLPNFDEAEEYDPEEHGLGSVIVEYVEVDDRGRTISILQEEAYVVEDAEIGESYETEQLEFEGYEFVGIPDDSAPKSGEIIFGEQKVIYQYREIVIEEDDDEDDDNGNGNGGPGNGNNNGTPPPRDDDDDEDDDEDDDDNN